MPRKTRKHVGLIGLGIIGSRAAAGLRACGFTVFVWNRTPQAAPNFLGSPAAVAEMCDLIQIFVADGQALFDVIEAMSEKLTSEHVIICSATVGLEATREAAKMVQAKGARFLDAPFTGSKGAAEKRQLVYYIGGDEATFLRAKPMLEANAKAIVQVGEVGHAAIVKIVTNMIAAVSIQTLAEALALATKAGVDPEIFSAALEQNACRSGTMDLKLPKMIRGEFEPHFSLKHMFKDVQLGIQMANAFDVEIPATTVTAGILYGALNHGWGDLDFSAIFKTFDPRKQEGESATLVVDDEEAAAAVERADDAAMEVVDSVPADAKNTSRDTAASEISPTQIPATPPEGGEQDSPKPFNRIKRFFTPHGG
jgi:3-hydroxyisobutyrate dehydrogenase-like beta-hydroxyacid dehydrogenase